jgi:hypothetical protein
MTDLRGNSRRVKMATIMFDAHIFALMFFCLRLPSTYDMCFKMNEPYKLKCVCVGFEVLISVSMKTLPCNHVDFHFRGEQAPSICTFEEQVNQATTLLTACFILVYCLVYSLTLNTEAVLSSETSANFYRNTQLHMLVICKTSSCFSLTVSW